MKKNKHLILSVSLLLTIISITEYGCKHNPVILPPDIPVICNLDNITFASTVQPVLQNNCYGCHSSITPNGGINLTDFNVVTSLVLNGKLSGVINRDEGFSPMPPGFALDSCTVLQIDSWIADTSATIIGTCDTVNVTFTGTVSPILQANCLTCHSGETPQGNLDLSDYAQLAIVAQNGALMGSIQHLDGFSPMPQNADKLDDCSIAQIGIWVRDTTFTPPGGGGGNDHPCDADTAYFQNQVLPLLISNCATSGCHDAASHKDGVILVDYASVMQTTEVKPGNPFDSELYKVLVDNEGDDLMPPPPASLTNDQINLVKSWIQQGAKDNYCEDCDTTNVTYSGSVWPTLETNCVGCHSGGSPGGGISITNYNEVVGIANNGQLMGSIKHEQGFSPMPKNGAKMADCKIMEFEIWIADGTPDN